MRIAFYGANRVAKDFYYVLKDTEMEAVLCFADASEDAAGFAQGTGLETVPVASLPALRANFDMLVVCDFSHEEKEQTLQVMGLAHGKDYQWVEELFPLFDDVRLNPEQKPMFVWGCGRKGEQFYHWNTAYKIEAYLDRAPQGEDFYGYPCRKPETVREWSRYFVVVAVARNKEICDFLEQQGGKRYRDFCTYEDIESLPSTLLRQTILQPEVYDFACRSMLNHAEIGGRGNVICCCSTFIRNSLGDLSEERSFRDCWNSVVHRILCLSNVNRTYSFCLHDMCPLFIGRHETRDYHLAEPYPEMEDAPRTVAVGFDYTCNLKCVTCRKDFRVAKEEDKRQIQSIAEMVRDQVLPGCEFMIMAGDGEVLLSDAYRTVYASEQMKHIRWFRLLTNGLLFTPKKWAELRRYTDAKIMMTVSIDAATPETYANIRRGGMFAVLERNMAYASQLRKIGELSYLRFNFVVQRQNYQEMIPFVEWGKRLGVDELFFTKILNWGTYSREEFRDISMMEENGITPKPELQAVLDQPIMRDPIVDLGTIRYQHDGTDTETVENYYRWELERKVPDLFGEGK